MTGKSKAMIITLLIICLFLPGSHQAEAREGGISLMFIPGSASPGVIAQVITSTPTPEEADETMPPIQSEVGRDFGIILGAVILVLIVIGGVIFSVRKQSPPKSRD